MTLASIPDLLAELRAGRPVILVDDEGRENEGDLLMPAETATPAVKPETDPTVAAEQALARRDRSVSGTVLTSWRGVLQPTATGSAAPVRKRLLGE